MLSNLSCILYYLLEAGIEAPSLRQYILYVYVVDGRPHPHLLHNLLLPPRHILLSDVGTDAYNLPPQSLCSCILTVDGT